MTHLTIPAGTPRVSYTANGSTDTFPVTFPFFDTADVLVYVDEVLQSSGYTVTGTAADGGYQDGNVVFTSYPAADAEVVLTRVIAIARTADFAYPSAVLPIADLNTEFDKVYALLQDLSRAVGRSVRLPDVEDGTTALLPARATRANGYQGFDANGDPTIKASVDLSGTSVSAFMNDLLDSADSTAALAALNSGRVLWCGTGTGSANAAVLSPATAITSLETGMLVMWITPASDSSAPLISVNISGLGTTYYVSGDGSGWGANALPASTLQLALYDGTFLRKVGASAKPVFYQISLPNSFGLSVAGGALDPRIDFDTGNDFLGFTKSTNRLAWKVGGTLAPLNVGAGALADDTVAMSQAWVKLQSTTISGSPTSVAFDLSTYQTRGFKSFRVYYRNLAPAVAAILYARFSVDAGATWKSAGGDYGNAWTKWYAGGGFPSVGGSGAGYVQLSGTVNIQAPAGHAFGVSGYLEWDDVSTVMIAQHGARYLSATPTLDRIEGQSNTTFAGPVNAVQIAFVGGGAFANQGSVHLMGLAA